MLAFAQQNAAWFYALAAWAGAGALGGAAIGWWARNRFWRGALLGALLGPVGWWLLWRAPGAFARLERIAHCCFHVAQAVRQLLFAEGVQ